MHWVAHALALVLASGAFEACEVRRPPIEAQRAPGRASRAMDGIWKSVALRMYESALHEVSRLPDYTAPETEDIALYRTTSTYGAIPEVRVDFGHGAIFPVPLQAPTRFSWFQISISSLDVIRRAGKRQSALALLDELTHIAARIRHLEAWIPPMDREWRKMARFGRKPGSHDLIRTLTLPQAELTQELRERLRPSRVNAPSFLPDKLPRGTTLLPIVTDITDPRFIAEVEGALATHWNQSPWARAKGARFKIKWRFHPIDKDFEARRIELSEHLARFPEGAAVMTTGALTTVVRGRALVLGTAPVTPRTLAHELGHLLGFDDCYFRSLASQGFFGLAVLEWDNPLYPDDLMCDNGVGVAKAMSW